MKQVFQILFSLNLCVSLSGTFIMAEENELGEEINVIGEASSAIISE